MFAPQGNFAKTIGLLAATASLSNFLEGYSSSYPNTAGSSFQKYINSSYIQRHGGSGMTNWAFTWFWSLLLNIWFVGYLLGTFITPHMTDTYGRKNALLIANSVCLLATFISVASVAFSLPELLIFGRAVGAAGSGVSFGSLILFLQETTPTSLRGVGVIPGILSILIMIPMKESPKYLLLNRHNRKAALESLIYYRGNHVNCDELLEEIAKESDSNTIELAPLRGIFEVLRQPYLRKAITIGILSLQIVVGIWPIVYISTELLEAHFEVKMAQYSSFAFICANFISSVIGMCAVERCGRRPMLIYCGIANTLCLCSYIFFDRMAAHYDHNFKYGCVVSLICYGMTYGAALGPIAFFITSELVPQRYRSLAQSIVFAVNTVINFTFSFLTLPFYQLINVWAFIPLFIIPSTFSIIYLIINMPETKGREVHVIVAELIKRSSKSAYLGNIIVPGLSPPDSLTKTIVTTISEEDLGKVIAECGISLESINLETNFEYTPDTTLTNNDLTTGFYANNLALSLTSTNNTNCCSNGDIKA
ncbi:sugar transporter domain-containing protein [Ditylenchus destructor]|nr:sugar transporter domain-containing protein [Ditylenchus destructor]